MRKAVPVVIILVIAVIAAGVFWNSRRVQAVNVKFNIKDVPEHGLLIISPSDPSFDNMMAVYLRSKPGVPLNDLKPFSIFIKNTSNRTVVGYTLKWECIKADGTVIPQIAEYATTWALTDVGESDFEAAMAEARTVIRPNAILFFSQAAPPELLDGQDLAPTQPDPEQTELLRSLNSELKNYTSITVSLDGALFDDGTFVGPDSAGFFAEIKAQVDAKYDLLREIESGIQQGKSADEIFRHAEEALAGPDIELNPDSTTADHYNYNKKLYGQEILGIRTALGDKKAIERVRILLSRPWPELRKL
jgi:hypothetical protein